MEAPKSIFETIYSTLTPSFLRRSNNKKSTVDDDINSDEVDMRALGEFATNEDDEYFTPLRLLNANQFVCKNTVLGDDALVEEEVLEPFTPRREPTNDKEKVVAPPSRKSERIRRKRIVFE